MYDVNIEWDDTTGAYMTLAESHNPVLRKFFSIKDWNLIKNIYQAVNDEYDVQYMQRSIEFYTNRVLLAFEEESTELKKDEFFYLVAHLFDIMITGANEDHHAVRYEPWWQAYTEVSFRLQCRVKLEIVWQQVL